MFLTYHGIRAIFMVSMTPPSTPVDPAIVIAEISSELQKLSTTSSAFNNSSSLHVSSFPSYPIYPTFSVKLNKSYLIWKEQLHRVITVYGLKRFVDGSAHAPVQYIKKTITTTHPNGYTTSHEVFDENSTFQPWDRQDCAIKNWTYSLFPLVTSSIR